jgi:hypothetical protein
LNSYICDANTKDYRYPIPPFTSYRKNKLKQYIYVSGIFKEDYFIRIKKRDKHFIKNFK